VFVINCSLCLYTVEESTLKSFFDWFSDIFDTKGLKNSKKKEKKNILISADFKVIHVL
jgi:hypothetical protein